MTRLSASALAVVAAAFSTALRTLGSSQLAAAAAAALAVARRAAAIAALSGELLPVALGTVVPRSSGAHCWYWAGGCRGGCSIGREARAYGVQVGPSVRFTVGLRIGPESPEFRSVLFGSV